MRDKRIQLIGSYGRQGAGAAGMLRGRGLIVLFGRGCGGRSRRRGNRGRRELGEGQAPLPAGLAGFILGGGQLRQEHGGIAEKRRHHIAEDPVPLNGFQRLQHPDGPAGSLPDIRFDDLQGHLVRGVPGSIDIVDAGTGLGIFINLQGQLMGNGQHAGEGISIAVGWDLDTGGRRHQTTSVKVLSRYRSATS